MRASTTIEPVGSTQGGENGSGTTEDVAETAPYKWMVEEGLRPWQKTNIYKKDQALLLLLPSTRRRTPDKTKKSMV